MFLEDDMAAGPRLKRRNNAARELPRRKVIASLQKDSPPRRLGFFWSRFYVGIRFDYTSNICGTYHAQLLESLIHNTPTELLCGEAYFFDGYGQRCTLEHR